MDSQLEFIGLGTDLTEGIEKGIHLRWSFPEKLGFPNSGVRLYRNTHLALGAMECVDYQNQSLATTISVLDKESGDNQNNTNDSLEWFGGFTGSDLKMPVRKISINKTNIKRTLKRPIRGYQLRKKERVNALKLPERINLKFKKCPPSRIEIYVDIVKTTRFTIIAQSGLEKYEAIKVSAPKTGQRKIIIWAPRITQLNFIGVGIHVLKICTYCCRDNNEWEQLTKNPYGFPISKNPPADYNEALRRLEALPITPPSPISEEEFNDLRDLMFQMQIPDGKYVPVGWSIPEIEDGEDESLETSSYDILRITQLNKKIARIIGTYWIDQDVRRRNIYDYKIEVDYPKNHLAKLEHQIDFNLVDSDEILHTTLTYDNVVFMNLSSPKIVENSSEFFRSNKGLSFNSTSSNFILGNETKIQFNRSVKEVQIFVKFTSSKLVIKARSFNDPNQIYPISETFSNQELVAKISGQKIDELILEGEGIVIYRFHYDYEQLSGLQLSKVICGLRPVPGGKLKSPKNLIATQLPSGSSYDENFALVSKYTVGLHWDAKLNPNRKRYANGPVAYHVYRLDSSSTPENITKEDPVYITSSSLEEQQERPDNWPNKRQYYQDGHLIKNPFVYRVSALDLFGRESRLSKKAIVNLVGNVPPPPDNVHAKYLDHSTLNNDGTSSDPNLNSDDIAILEREGVSGIVVDWNWTEAQAAVCDDVKKFEIHFEHGWLNLFKGSPTSTPIIETLTISDLALTTDELVRFPSLDGPLTVKTYRFDVELDKGIIENGMRLNWLKQGYNAFLVLKNSSGTSGTIWVLDPKELIDNDDVNAEVNENKAFSVALDNNSPGIIDFKNPDSWTDTSISADVIFSDFETDTGDEKTYRHFIASPAFPDPVFVVGETKPMRYGQISVNTWNSEDVEGSISNSSAILAVYRTGPEAIDPSYLDYGTAMATPPDVHGKSTFYMRWRKASSGLKHFVYRTMDEVLFQTDLANNYRKSEYEALAADLSLSYNVNIHLFSSVAEYKDLSTDLMFLIANMSGNEDAFTKMNSEPINESDSTYENRDTDIPAIGDAPASVSSNYLLFEDNTLDGRGSNYYFYRLRTIDSAGNLGEFAQTSPPVVIPQILPAVKPVITKIVGGENEISIEWTVKSNPNILGYRLYRTTEKNKSGDWRRMELLLTDPDDEYTVNTGSDTSFLDDTIIARTPYYYGVVAFLDDPDGNKTLSEMSQVRVGQGFDLTPPDAPEWDEENSGWVYLGDDGIIYESEGDVPGSVTANPVVKLSWTAEGRITEFMIQRKSTNLSNWNTLLDFGGSYEESGGIIYFIDENLDESKQYFYRAIAKSAGAIKSVNSTKKTVNNLNN